MKQSKRSAGTGFLIDAAKSQSKGIIYLLLIALTGVMTSLGAIHATRLLIDDGILASQEPNILTTLVAPHLGAVLRQPSVKIVLFWAFSMLASAILFGITQYFSIYQQAKVSLALTNVIRLGLFAKVIRLPISFFKKTQTGDILVRVIDDATDFGDFLASALWLPVFNCLLIVIYFIYLFILDYRLAVLCVVLIPMNVLVFSRFNPYVKQLAKEGARIVDGMYSKALETIEGVFEVRSFAQFEKEERSFRPHLDDFANINLKSAQLSGFLQMLAQLTYRIVPFGLYLIGGYLCIKSSMQIGKLTVFVAMSQALYNPVNQLIGFQQAYQRNRVLWGRINDYLLLDDEMPAADSHTAAGPEHPAIRFDEVSFGYSQNERIVHNIDIDIPSGKSVALVGPSGSGKSTVALIADRLLLPTGGRACLGDMDIKDCHPALLSKKVAVVSQNPYLFSGTIYDNFTYGLSPDKAREYRNSEFMNEIIKDVNLADDLFSLVLGTRPPGSDPADADLHRKMLACRDSLWQTRDEQVGLFVPYDPEELQRSATIAENILYAAISDHDPWNDVLIAWFESCGGGEGILEFISELGQRRLAAIHRAMGGLPEKLTSLLAELGVTQSMLDHCSASSKDHDPDVAALHFGLTLIPDEMAGTLLDEESCRRILAIREELKEVPLPEGLFRLDLSQIHPELTVQENILFGRVSKYESQREALDQRIQAAALKQGLFETLLNLSLEYQVGKNGSRLSGGQRQKVALARAFFVGPEILILDEATSALDNKSQLEVSKAIEKRFADRTVIIVAHRLSTVKDCDQLLVFSRGRIVQKGTFRKLAESEGLFAELLAAERGL